MRLCPWRTLPQGSAGQKWLQSASPENFYQAEQWLFFPDSGISSRSEGDWLFTDYTETVVDCQRDRSNFHSDRGILSALSTSKESRCTVPFARIVGGEKLRFEVSPFCYLLHEVGSEAGLKVWKYPLHTPKCHYPAQYTINCTSLVLYCIYLAMRVWAAIIVEH